MKDEELQVLVELHDVLNDSMPAISAHSIAEARRNTTSPRTSLVWRQREQRARAVIKKAKVLLLAVDRVQEQG
jgi:hypothetical protein